MTLYLASFGSTSKSTVQSVILLRYGLAYRELWAVFHGRKRGVLFSRGSTCCSAFSPVFLGLFSAYEDETSPHVLVKIQNMLFVTSNTPSIPHAVVMYNLNITKILYSLQFRMNGPEEINRHSDSLRAASLSLLYKGYWFTLPWLNPTWHDINHSPHLAPTLQKE